jgi:pilus assembly protein Flp/PilA
LTRTRWAIDQSAGSAFDGGYVALGLPEQTFDSTRDAHAVEAIQASHEHRGGFRVTECLKRFIRDDHGQNLIEYAVLVGFISLIAVAAITSVGKTVNGVFNNINAEVNAIPGAAS